MSLEFSWLNNKPKKNLMVDENCINLLGSSFEALKQKTGIHIDQYSDHKLSPEHANILLSEMNKLEFIKNYQFDQLKLMFNESVKSSKWILILGD